MLLTGRRHTIFIEAMKSSNLSVFSSVQVADICLCTSVHILGWVGMGAPHFAATLDMETDVVY